MKKILLAAILFALAFNVNAQELKYGLKAGINLANLTGVDEFDSETKFGYHAGGFLHIGLAEKFGLQPEILFSTQGTEFTVEDLSGSQDFKFNLTYINVPIMAKFYPIPGFSIQAGPQFGLLLGADFESEISGVTAELDVKDGVNNLDLSAAFGLGYEINKLNVGARYTLGLNDIQGDAISIDGTSPAEKLPDFKNGVFQVYVGYAFN